jgi:DNA-binding transcriptional ArsR family regulator
VEVFKALASDTRIALLRAIADAPLNISTLGQMLGITQSGATKHIQQLEAAGLIEIEHRPGTQGTQKVCRLRYDMLQLVLAGSSLSDVDTSQVSTTVQTFAVEAANLEVIPPECEGELRSIDDAVETNLIFVNNSEAALERFWLNFEGERQSYGLISPGSTISQRTYSDHPWLVEAPGGQVLGIFRPNAHVGCIVVSDAPEQPPMSATDSAETSAAKSAVNFGVELVPVA